MIMGGVSRLHFQGYPTTYKLRYSFRQVLIMDMKHKN